MSAVDQSRHDGMAATPVQDHRKLMTGPQGEALIVELRKAKAAVDRLRQNARTKQATPQPARSTGPEHTSPEHIVRRFPGARSRLDQFEPSALQEPIRLNPKNERIDAEEKPEEVLAATGEQSERVAAPGGRSVTSALAPAIHAAIQALRAASLWLFSDAPATSQTQNNNFAMYVASTHEIQLKAAARVLVLSAAVVGGWATLVPLSGAVVLPGTLVVESSVKKIQHPTGGVVAEIAVQDGMHVDAGTLLARLDETQVRANETLVADQLDQIRARVARLVGERDGLDHIEFPEQLTDRQSDPNVAHLIASETALFKARAAARQGEKLLYNSNIRQFEEQINGLNAEIVAKSSQLDLIASELTGVKELYAKGLVPLTRMTSLQRDAARLDGERAELTATIAATRAKIGQSQLQITHIDQDFLSEVMKDLRDAQDKEAELRERNVSAKDQLQRTEIHAPTSGIVQQLAIHTMGGVVRPGDVIMEIVPDSDDLEIEGHLPPNEIDQVRSGQRAYLRFSTLDRPTMPEVTGTVSYVSPDLTHDQQTNAGFYTVKIDLPGGERHHLDGMTLVSGMPVEIFLQTGSRTMLKYLLKPITDQLHRMFNEP